MSQPITSEPQWPPRSPHEALLSTPGGRDRLRRLAERASPSPSPIKRSISTPSIQNQAKRGLKGAIVDSEEDEDEETLQLRLQEIQARLKLKKLQKKAAQSSDTEKEISRAGTASLSRASSAAASRAQSRLADLREERLQRSKSQAEIHVPVSPIRRSQPNELPKSPSRVLLGIDKGLKGSDVSLRRAPSSKKLNDAGSQDSRRLGPFLQRPPSQVDTRVTSQSLGDERPKSFNERMASVRQQESERLEKELRIKKNRSQGFDIDHQKMQTFKEAAVELPDFSHRAPEFSREDVLKSYSKPIGDLARSKTTPNLRSAMRSTGISTSTADQSEPQSSMDIPVPKRTSSKKAKPCDFPESESAGFEPYSSIHLSRRIVPHQEVTRTLTGKKTFTIPDLLRTVKGPDFSGPDTEEDVVVFGIIAKKSDPRSHTNNDQNKNRGKYMIMSLTDLKWELDLFLFDSAFEKFWKLTTGTVIAILNPTFMPPPRGREDTGKFSLTLNSNADTILEIGTARDLGFCKSIKKDSSTCDTWVNIKKTEFCEYHTNLTLEKTRSNRMEVATMNFGRGFDSGRKFNSKDMTGHFERKREQEQKKKTRYDVESHSQIFIGRSTANLLDDPDVDPDAFHRGSTKEERMTRHLLAQEKERDLAKKLGQMGGGLGAAYMRRKDSGQHNHDTSGTQAAEVPPPDATSLGLLTGKAKDVHLSPVKRKRANTASVSAAGAIGWGGNLSKELGRMKNGESLQPVKKKTRFVTEKGIREAGRESIGGDAVKAAVNDLDDDDDDLDIVGKP